ncbi:Uncharacterized protein TPAR_03791 [Tolypocladium paradoxum]|uniref:Zn(2)-C6 fungal-type domain-containing protein n=1 Tax=Tolypocladium paradoxum TaxID=94208 RepID=A0A2S4L0P2_9HYPO|nr:Uncharacterized protein TPAR_03791 [Tolypocladium paradoxum]
MPEPQPPGIPFPARRLTNSRKRHVKCDETRPACLNCLKWRGYCDSYADESDSQPTRASSSNANTKLIHSKKAPLILTEPVINSIRFASGDQRAYFDAWSALSVTFLSGGLSQTRLWTATMPQLSLEETTLRYGAMAVGALRKAYEVEEPSTALSSGNRHYLNAVIYYCEALRLQSKARPTKEGLRTALLSSLLFICFEAQRGNMAAALKHVTHGFSMLNELASCTDKAADLVSIAPAPPALVQEILDCYKPLELQSRSFMGSYKKFFFPPNSMVPRSAHGGAQPGPASSTGSPPPGASAQTPPSQPGTPWRAAPPASSQASQTGLPSPQSQGSPGSPAPGSAEGQSPPQGALRRPPGILPFTKHSPYFRPKLSTITTLDDMPPDFRDMDESQGYWALVQKNMVQNIPMLTMVTSGLALTRAASEAELEMKLASVKQNPLISNFIAESRYWLQRWIEAYEPLFRGMSRNSVNDARAYLQAINLRIEYLILYIYTTIPRFSGLVTAKGLTPQYKEINRFAETLLVARPNCGFAMDSGWTWPLFVSSFGCRDPAVRADAIRILGQYPIRNALRDSRVFRAIALKNEEVEAKIAMEGDEREQWLRLRRRELVFEDFGTNIIYRSSQKDPVTGRWELVEEAADSTVAADGRLKWQRVPISDSASILSGVC